MNQQERDERLAARIREIVDTAPPLTQAQLDTLAALLRPSTRRQS